jgi:uncharacterized protein with ParB-like and HNH nuclease domain/predicted transport protein
MTTITLLLFALGNSIHKKGVDVGVTQEEINEYFIFNRLRTDDLRYKLLLNEKDKLTLISLLDGKEMSGDASKTVLNNYHFFEEMIDKSGIDLSIIYKGISGLKIVDIVLEQGHDNPQLIFESLNSTGLDLTQSDLIRNYVLMGLDYLNQKEIYEKYWRPMELGFNDSAKSDSLDRFFRDYLTLKTGEIPVLDQVYREFKNFLHVIDEKRVQEVVSDLFTYSKYYVRFALEKEKDPVLKTIFSDINTLRMEVAYTFMLEIFHDYSNNRLTRDEFVEMLKMLESYVFRRAIAGISTSSLNKTFAALSKELNKERYLESFKAALILKDSYRRYPKDQEFAQEFMIKDVYNFRSRHYWLLKLENFEHREPIQMSDWSVEHIMPQVEDLSDEWKTELGEQWQDVHEKYLHTAGNLTLTRYNSLLGTHPFQEKRDAIGGFKDSHLRLNNYLATLDHWNEAEIKRRGQQLADLVVKVWPYPELQPEILQTYKKVEKPSGSKIFTLADHVYLTGKMEELFNQLRQRILNLDPSVYEDIRKFYIAYKTTTNFVDVAPQKSRLRLTLNLKFNQVYDPKGLCKDMTNLGRWGNGDVGIELSSVDQLDDIMALVKQSFEKHSDMNS